MNRVDLEKIVSLQHALNQARSVSKDQADQDWVRTEIHSRMQESYYSFTKQKLWQLVLLLTLVDTNPTSATTAPKTVQVVLEMVSQEEKVLIQSDSDFYSSYLLFLKIFGLHSGL